MPDFPTTLGELRTSHFSAERMLNRDVKDELRENLICKLQRGEALFPGVVGYDDTVVPQIVNAVLSKHNFILLGLRGQAKTRIIRLLITLLDPQTPYVAGCEIRDNPYQPICRRCRDLIALAGEETPIAWLGREQRYVEKLATPDVTIADMIGDIDPIKAARGGHDIANELTVHYGLLPRANRGIFAINELPDLAGKIQVGLFNIMQEGDVQIKGYPVRLPLDVMLVFTANPEDYTARGKIITPLKDRIGSEIRTHYPATLEHGITITTQESWTKRTSPVRLEVPNYIRETVEQLAFLAREDKKVDKRSGVSQRLPISALENVVSNAERRALRAGEDVAVPRVLDIYSALPSITGKLELEYEGELKGGDAVARELIRAAVGKVYSSYFEGVNVSPIVQWFELGGTLRMEELVSSAEMVKQLSRIQGLMEKTGALGLAVSEPDAVRASAAEFILEGLYAHRRISRNEETGFTAGERKRETPEREEGGRQKPRRQFN
ncbi:MAG: sigma 54-interacting transcriptional regulator [Acidobacteriota bacterium]|nr:sigma 54-interacting transcriptional regulator [Acidobacteriota bacterium]